MDSLPHTFPQVRPGPAAAAMFVGMRRLTPPVPAVRVVFQPIVELASGRTVAIEALARGPAGTARENPGALFAAARASGTLEILESACRRAIGGALERAGVAGRVAVFVNAEPDALRDGSLGSLVDLRRRIGDVPAVVEFTERALTRRPAELVAAVERLRAAGWCIAADDVGVDPRSLALLPLLRPEVVKLDLGLLRARPGPALAEVFSAVSAERERSGAIVVAEGIETAEHLQTARALGATHGQGFLFGPPTPVTAGSVARAAALVLPRREPLDAAGPTPFALVSERMPTRVADKRLLLAVSDLVEGVGRNLGSVGVVLSAFQSADRFTARTRERYRAMARELALVAALGVGMDPAPEAGVRGAALRPDDPLRGEWSVVALGPHDAVSLVAADMGDAGPDLDRRFRFALTHDRALVTACARSLMAKIAA